MRWQTKVTLHTGVASGSFFLPPLSLSLSVSVSGGYSKGLQAAVLSNGQRKARPAAQRFH